MPSRSMLRPSAQLVQGAHAAAAQRRHRLRRRLSAVCCLAFVAVSGRALAQAAVTEAEAARLAVAGPEWDQVMTSRRAASEARAAATGLRPDPELEAAREGAEGLGGEGAEDSFRLSYPLDLGGARRADRRAGQARRDAELAEIEDRVAERAAQARTHYHEFVSLSRREAVLARRAALLDTALDITRRRFREGDVPELELRRLEMEAAAAQAAQARTGADRAAAAAQLSAFIGPVAAAPPGAAATPLAPLDAYAGAVDQSPAVRRARAEAAAAEAEAETARRRSRFADAAVFGGLRSLDDPAGRTTGVVVGGRVGLPVIAGGRARLKSELAEANAARAEERLVVEQRQRSVAAAYATAARLSQAAVIATAAADRQESVFGPARAAWEGGEIDLTELLTIYRTANEAELAAVDLALEAAKARVGLDRLVGRIEP